MRATLRGPFSSYPMCRSVHIASAVYPYPPTQHRHTEYLHKCTAVEIKLIVYMQTHAQTCVPSWRCPLPLMLYTLYKNFIL